MSVWVCLHTPTRRPQYCQDVKINVFIRLKCLLFCFWMYLNVARADIFWRCNWITSWTRSGLCFRRFSRLYFLSRIRDVLIYTYGQKRTVVSVIKNLTWKIKINKKCLDAFRNRRMTFDLLPSSSTSRVTRTVQRWTLLIPSPIASGS